MTTASVTTDIHIGPFKIPSNGQNMIMKQALGGVQYLVTNQPQTEVKLLMMT